MDKNTGFTIASLFRRISDTSVAALAATLLVAAVESAQAQLPLALTLGLSLPFALLLGVLLGFGSALLAPASRYGVVALLDWSKLDLAHRQRLAAICGLVPILAALWLLLSASGSLWLLANVTDLKRVGAIAASFTGLTLLGAGAAAARLARSNAVARSFSVSPAVSLLGSLALVLSALLILVASGNTAGDGGLFSIWGVLRRQELDLRLPAALLFIAVCAFQLPAFTYRLASAVSVGGLLVALALTTGLALSADRLLQQDSLSPDADFGVRVERGTALASMSLRRLRAWSDRDHDGFAARFGGGDCNDADSRVNPAAVDVAGNGIDEDCSGTDATVHVAAATPAPQVEQPITTTQHAAAPNKKWNVVLITIDTLRHDLGFLGYERPISRNIDALAAKSTLYEKAYALASYTSKSLAPMLIGRYGSETHRGWMHFDRYPAEDKMLQEYARDAGIKTLSIQGHWYFDEKSGLGRGFDVLDLSAAPKVKQAEGDKTTNSAEISDAAIAALHTLKADQPFYLWAHYLDPHAEYVAHDAYQFGKNQRALYDGEVAYTDEHIGRLLAAIQASAFADNTVIVLTSDHGEAFSEHDMVRHGFELWEELVRVPLMVYVPGVAAIRHQVRRSAIDLVPTILEFLGVSVSPGALRGVSLVSEITRPSGAQLPARPIFIDMPAGPYNGERQAYIASDLKLVVSNLKAIGLYDLKTDAGERTNLAKTPRLGPALEELKAFRDTLTPVFVKPQ